MSTHPLLVIGLDGVDFRYLNRFSEDLPHIRRLRNNGVEASLQSTHPPWTGSAWPSMYTGLDPSYHGVYDFFDYRGTYPDEAEIVSRNSVRAPAVWNYFSQCGLENIVVNVPITHPAEELNGVLLPGYLAPSDAEGYPSGIRAELSDALGAEYQIYSNSETGGKSADEIDEFESLIRKRAEASEYLLQTKEWDFAFVQVQKTDTVFHNSSSPADFRRIYKAADDLIGCLLATVKSTPNVVIVSDHGMGPTTGHEVYINELLREHNFIETQSDPTTLELSELKTETKKESNTPTVLTRIVDVLKNIGVDPTTAYQFAERVGIEEQILRRLPTGLKQSLAEGVNWRTSQAYCRRTSEHGIRINLDGRDPEGIVSSEAYEQIRSEIIQLLSDLETTDGEPIFELVCPREEIYEGPYADDACDILFRTTNMNHEISTHFHGRVLGSIDAYNHKPNGVFVANGPTINEEWTESGLHLTDVAPILFALLREPIPERLIGTAPSDLVSVDYETASYSDVQYGGKEEYSQDRAEATERLKDLGYL